MNSKCKNISCSQNWEKSKKKKYYFKDKCYDVCQSGTYLKNEDNNICINYPIISDSSLYIEDSQFQMETDNKKLNCSAKGFFNNLCTPNISSFKMNHE